MALLLADEWDDHLPGYSLLVFRDGTGERLAPPPGLVPAEEGVEVPGVDLVGGLVSTGLGWMFGNLRWSDREPRVRFEVWDDAPDLDLDSGRWEDVVETPYWSASGTVILDELVHTGGLRTIRLGSPGAYRMRASYREGFMSDLGAPVDEAQPRETADGVVEEWRVQTWPDRTAADGGPEPPRWRARRRTAAAHRRTSGWSSTYLGHVGMDLLDAVQALGRPVTAAEITAWYAERGGDADADALAAPLWPSPSPPHPTGHPDQDAELARRHAERIAEGEAGRARLAGFAAELGVPVPGTRGELLDFLVAAGQLTATDSPAGEADQGPPGGPGAADAVRVRTYQAHPDPPTVAETVTIPAAEAANLDRHNATRTQGELAADVLAVVTWSPDRRYPTTTAALADRLLISTERAREVLRHLVDVEVLTVEGDPAHEEAGIVLRWRAHTTEPPVVTGVDEQAAGEAGGSGRDAFEALLGELAERYPSPSAVVPPPDATGRSAWFTGYFALPGPAPRAEAPAAGAPPRHGIVTSDGAVVVWRCGNPVTLARLPGSPSRAVATPFGVVVATGDGLFAVRPDGQVDRLADDVHRRFFVTRSGRFAAVVEAEWPTVRMRDVVDRLTWISVVDGSRRVAPLDPDNDVRVVGVHGETAFVEVNYGGSAHGRRGGYLGWTPDDAPQWLERGMGQVDPLSGAQLGYRDGAPLVTWLDGSRFGVPIDPTPRLAPGGRRVYTLRHDRPAMTFFDVTDPSEPAVTWLPTAVRPDDGAWEDERNLLLLPEGWLDGGWVALRCDTHTGRLTRVPLPGEGPPPILVRALS
ncbi:DUF6042 family protein [Frankia sp. QA3]|uniref:DUF6042 family protein n=1 Tax=Frankia sp. QA3 TaxID=710111 RepID=UPI000269BE56|nr:DUF6042 family protein [Frankia sp. QA3]EIV92352.1 hypothetical protein FraQA3DRAFT_1895 [Frankia sp. QA3]